MAIISRGFSGRRSTADAKLPPGQYLTTDFPVLSAGPTPRISLDQWEFTINDGNRLLKRWDWKAFRELPIETITVDLHCVTRWSKLGTNWEGVSLDVLLADAKTDLSYAMFLYIPRLRGLSRLLQILVRFQLSPVRILIDFALQISNMSQSRALRPERQRRTVYTRRFLKYE